MKILAVEFSSSHRSVAVLGADGAVLGGAGEIDGRNTIALVERALAEARVEREEIGLVAVGLGPGSYAGIRGAIALAQGWQLGRSVKLLGLSSFDCLAAQARAEKIFGEVHIVIDGQRDEFYVERYEIGADLWWVVQPLRLAPFSEIEKSGGRIVGPDIASVLPGGSNLYPTAAALGQLAAKRTDFVTGDKLEPIYLRATAFKKAPPRREVL